MERIKPALVGASSQPSTADLRNSTQRQATILRCQKVLFAAYRADQYADAETFMASLGAVLEEFPDEVIIYITDPRTGIQRRSKWPPTISEVLSACEEHQEHLTRIRAPRLIAKPQPRRNFDHYEHGHFAAIFVPDGHPRYAGLVTWTETADRALWKYGPSSDSRAGLWVSHQAWNDPQSTKPRAAKAE